MWRIDSNIDCKDFWYPICWVNVTFQKRSYFPNQSVKENRSANHRCWTELFTRPLFTSVAPPHLTSHYTPNKTRFDNCQPFFDLSSSFAENTFSQRDFSSIWKTKWQKFCHFRTWKKFHGFTPSFYIYDTTSPHLK